MTDIVTYREILTRIRDYLGIYNDTRWRARVEEWLRELDDVKSSQALLTHLERSQRATGGMGLLGDLTICPQNGHTIANDRMLISEASTGLWSLTSELYRVTADLMRQTSVA